MELTWDRLRRDFDDPRPPRTVWQRQFDYDNAALERLARTPWHEIDRDDLWYYHHDLAYVELQPDLFAYLFPVCLMDWHLTLQEGFGCSHGDSEFHYGVHHGDIFQQMLSPRQRQATYQFFCDSFLDCLDHIETPFLTGGGPAMPNPAAWLFRFNSLAHVIPEISLLWKPWWSLKSTGRAIAALQYVSGFVYLEGEHVLTKDAPVPSGRTPPALYVGWNDCGIHHQGWLPANVEFLKSVLNAEFLAERLDAICERLGDSQWLTVSQQIRGDFERHAEIVERRLLDLPTLLDDPDTWDWPV